MKLSLPTHSLLSKREAFPLCQERGWASRPTLGHTLPAWTTKGAGKGQHLQTQEQGNNSQEPSLLPRRGLAQSSLAAFINSIIGHKTLTFKPPLLSSPQSAFTASTESTQTCSCHYSFSGRGGCHTSGIRKIRNEGSIILGCAQFTGQTPKGSFLLDPRRYCRAKLSERRLGFKPTLQHQTSINSIRILPAHKSVGSSCTTQTTKCQAA